MPIGETIARVKYEPILRRLGLRKPQAKKGRGFIIIHIDALAFDYLIKAVQRGYMPFVRKLLEGGNYKLELWDCGLPSATPSFQAGLFYGDNFDICGFRWYEKDRNFTIEGKNPQAMHVIQERLARGTVPLLEGGAAYFSMLDGGASTALFTLGAMSSSYFLPGLRNVTWALFFLLNPLRFLRIFGLSLWEYARWWAKRLFRSFFPSPLPWTTKPFLNITVNILFREMQTYACLMDIYRGLPAIYVNYFGYDEVAHQTGPSAAEALRVLKGIDSQIRQIFKMCSREPFNRYDVFIMSDHGLTPSVPFREAFGQSLGDFIRGLVERVESLREISGPERSQYRGPWRKLLKAFRNISPWFSEELPTPEEEVIVSCSGPLAHVYFNAWRERLSFSQISSLYPNLLKGLIEHPGVGLVALKEGEEIHLLSARGSAVIKGGEVQGDLSFLAPYGEPEDVAKEIARLASFPHSGDVIVVGAMKGKSTIVTFEDQKATHGGPGGAQTRAFIIYPAYIPLKIGPQTRPHDFYRFFLNYYRPELNRKPFGVRVDSEAIASGVSHQGDTPPSGQLHGLARGRSAGD
jgi:hypothetical protein